MARFLTRLFPPFPSVIRSDFFFEARYFIGGDQTGSYRDVDIAVDLYDLPSAIHFALWYDVAHIPCTD